MVPTSCLFTFWLGNVLRTTRARECVKLFISHLARWLRTRGFSKPTFRPSGATNHWKNTLFCNFPTFSRTCIFFLLTFSPWICFFFWLSLLTLPISAFRLSILSEVWLLNFLRSCWRHTKLQQLHGKSDLTVPTTRITLRISTYSKAPGSAT